MNTLLLRPRQVRPEWRALFLLSLFAASRLFAADAPATDAVSARPAVAEPPPPHWLTATVDLDYLNQSGQTPIVRLYPPGHLIPPGAWLLAQTSFGLISDPGPPTITSFAASLAFLRTSSPGLTATDRLNVMSGIGYQLNLGYSATVSNNPSMESIFQNARLHGVEGGICGDIHTYLSQVAPQFGFVAAGTHTTYWHIDATAGGGHAVAHYRDPVTGEYYMQNYSQIYATGQQTLQNLLEVSNRILGATFASSVESQPGHMHQYVPRQAAWVSGLVAEEASTPLGGPHLQLSLGNREQSAAGQFGWAKGRHQLKLYAVGSRFAADEGDYGFADAGASYTFAGSITPGFAWLGEAGTRSTVHADALWMDLPLLRAETAQQTLRPVQWNTSTGYFGALLSGFLRQGRTTETAEVDWSGLGMAMQARQEVRLAIDHAFASVPVHVYLKRVWDVVDANGQPKTAEQIVTAYDQLGAQLHVAVSESLTCGFTADAFALEGFDANAGSAVRLGFAATWVTPKAGTFTVADDWGRVMRNRRNDPFYDLPASHYATARWQRPLGRNLSVALQAGYGQGPGVQPFGYFGPETPGLNNGARQFTCRVAVNFTR